jgi:hypothetical protein
MDPLLNVAPLANAQRAVPRMSFRSTITEPGAKNVRFREAFALQRYWSSMMNAIKISVDDVERNQNCDYERYSTAKTSTLNPDILPGIIDLVIFINAFHVDLSHF